MNTNTLARLFSHSCSRSDNITGVSTDSRQIKPGNVFVALEGANFDGHQFIQEAANKGAVAAVVKHLNKEVTIPQFVVADPVKALADIAVAHRQAIECPVIALTGSNGKTTVKEMIAAILPPPSLATQGNLNNHIGVPLSVLQLTAEHLYAVFELGANHVGEIAYTVEIVKPQVTLVNNIAPAHIEGFGSIDKVAVAKGEIYQGLSPSGIAVVNDDDNYAHFWDEILENKQVIRFSLEHAADVSAQSIVPNSQGGNTFSLALPNQIIDIQLQVPGLHNVRNALAAAACCHAIGISAQVIKRGLDDFKGVKGRLTLLPGKNNAIILDDTYNANLNSVLSGLEVLAARSGKKIFVCGDLAELGQWTQSHHQQIGIAARRLGINLLYSCGIHSQATTTAFGEQGQHFSNQDELVKALLNELEPNTSVLIKGSRSSAMEKIVHKLLN